MTCFNSKASHVSTSKDLARVLESSLAFFKDLNSILVTENVHGSSSSVAKGPRWRRNFKEKEMEYPRKSMKAQKLPMNTVQHNLRRQSVRSPRTLVAISANLLRSYDFHSSSTESSQFVLGVAKYVNGLRERISHHAAGSR